jgi:uncharacterized protein
MQPTPVTHLLYLHGFRSSPLSTKAQRVAREVQRLQRLGRPLAWCCPQLPVSPHEAMACIEQCLADWPHDAQRLGVIGSSLGGFYATAVAERRGCRAVLLNPAVHPARDLAAHVGEHPTWQQPEARVFFRPEYVDELRALAVPAVTRPERYLLVAATGDELLDWREMVQHYPGAALRLVEGSDHALSDFEHHLPAVLAFLGLST